MSSAVRDRLRMIQLRQAEQARGGALVGGFRIPSVLKKIGRDVAHQTLRNIAPGHAAYIEQQAEIRKRLNKRDKAIKAARDMGDMEYEQEAYNINHTYPETYYTETNPNSDLIDLTGFGRSHHRRHIGGALVGGASSGWTDFLKEHLKNEIREAKAALPTGSPAASVRNAAIRSLSEQYHNLFVPDEYKKPLSTYLSLASVNTVSQYKQRKLRKEAKDAEILAQYVAPAYAEHIAPVMAPYTPSNKKISKEALNFLEQVAKIPVHERTQEMNDAVLQLLAESKQKPKPSREVLNFLEEVAKVPAHERSQLMNDTLIQLRAEYGAGRRRTRRY
jgi:hypothetical protein